MTSEIVCYLLVKMTNQIISYFANKKEYPCPNWQGGLQYACHCEYLKTRKFNLKTCFYNSDLVFKKFKILGYCLVISGVQNYIIESTWHNHHHKDYSKWTKKMNKIWVLEIIFSLV